PTPLGSVRLGTPAACRVRSVAACPCRSHHRRCRGSVGPRLADVQTHISLKTDGAGRRPALSRAGGLLAAVLSNGTGRLCRTTQTRRRRAAHAALVPVRNAAGPGGNGAMTVRAQVGGFLFTTREYPHDLSIIQGFRAGLSGACRPRRSTGNVPVGGLQP